MEYNKKYDELYEKANKLVEEEKPCRIDERGVCIRERVNEELFDKYKPNNCCGSPKPRDFSNEGTCKFLDPNKGCTVEALNCTLWFCDFIRLMYKKTKFLKEIDKLLQEAHVNDFIDHRKPKEYTLKRLELQDRIKDTEKELKKLGEFYE